METPERSEQSADPAAETTGDESVEEYKEQVESDFDAKPDDEEFERLRGG